MAIDAISLRKLLCLLYASDRQRKGILREDIRTGIAKVSRGSGDGRDFYVPFWADVKAHIAGEGDLREATKERARVSRQRRRLYPILADGFMKLWDEKRRWRNEPFEAIPISVSGRISFPEIDAVVKIENVLCVKIKGEFDRVIYPYFTEAPPLSEEGARLGLWAMSQALIGHSTEELRIIDVQRSASFSVRRHPLVGNEEIIFKEGYARLVSQWKELKREYE